MSYAGQRVLVFGATGFIGRHVAATAVQAGADVVTTARSTGDASHVGCDVMQPDDVARLVRRVQPAFVFNLAGYGVYPTERDARVARRINAEFPEQLAELLAGTPGARLVHAGSALEYGTAAGDLNEATACTPTTLYGQTKLAGTRAVRARSEAGGLRAVTARLFTVYGPGEKPVRLLPALMAAARTRQPLPLTAGEQQRDFTFVGDVAAGLLRLGLSDAQPGEVVNLATGELTTVRTFAERAARVLGMDAQLLQFGALPTRAEEMAHDPVSVRRLRELTGWVPTTSIEEGVRQTAGR